MSLIYFRVRRECNCLSYNTMKCNKYHIALYKALCPLCSYTKPIMFVILTNLVKVCRDLDSHLFIVHFLQALHKAGTNLVRYVELFTLCADL